MSVPVWCLIIFIPCALIVGVLLGYAQGMIDTQKANDKVRKLGDKLGGDQL